jgi:predicted PhzF superfamily epimerase YddE/YHI9
MSIPLFQVDSFTDRPFAGNPAGVCLPDGPCEPEWMQAVAREMNLSETAFVVPQGEDYHLRWFTPAVEVELCGHATLASAHVLWETGRLAPGVAARFRTRSGLLTAEPEGDWIRLDFPANPARECAPPAGLLEALGAEARFVGLNVFDYLVELADESAVRGLTPDVTALGTLSARGVVVTAPSAGRFDFVSRFFAPAAGIAEDPVTGSAHCCLAPYWGQRLGKTEMWGYQASARGGVVGVRLAGERVHLLGKAVTVLRGEWVG